MVDYIAMLAIGTALFIGLIPLMFKRFRGGNFLISYVDMSEEEEVAWWEHRNKKLMETWRNK
jgi:hypothetical protein